MSHYVIKSPMPQKSNHPTTPILIPVIVPRLDYKERKRVRERRKDKREENKRKGKGKKKRRIRDPI